MYTIAIYHGKGFAMTEFTMTLAGVPLRVQALWPQTERYCGDYLSDEEPRETLTLSQALIDAERDIAARDAQPVAQFSDANLELLALHRLAANVLLGYGAVVFHRESARATGSCAPA